MVLDVKEAFYDPDCKEPIKFEGEQEIRMMRAQRLIDRGNQIIQSKECEYMDPSQKSDFGSLKSRFYCLDDKTV